MLPSTVSNIRKDVAGAPRGWQCADTRNRGRLYISIGQVDERGRGAQHTKPKVLWVWHSFISYLTGLSKPFFCILEQIANTISCYFLLWGDKGCWKFKLVPSIRLCCPKAGLEKTQHHKKLPHCQGLGNYPQKWILVLKRMHRLLEIMNTFALIFGGWYFRIGASCGGYFRIFHRLQNNWRKP